MKFTEFTPSAKAAVLRYLIPGIILAHLAITITLAKIENIWIDEGFSLHTTQYGVGQAIRRAMSFEEQPPMYFALLSLWRKINASYFFARLFSVICIFLSLVIFTNISHKLINDLHPAWITAVIAFNPFIIWAATELRCYAFVILMATLLGQFFWEGYLSEPPKERAKWYYALCALIALYTFYFLGFLLIANACALIILKRWRALRTYLLSMVLVALGFAPFIWVVLHQVSVATTTAVGELTLWEGLTWVGRTVLFFLLLIHSDDPSLLLTLARIAVLGVVLGIVGYKLRQKPHHSFFPPEARAYLTILTVLFFAHTGVVTFLGPLSLYYRYLLYILPSLFGGVFLGVSALGGKKGVIACACLMLCVGIAGDLVKFPRIKLGDWARVAAYIMHAEQPEQPILLYCSDAALPFQAHYAGINTIMPTIPQKMNFDKFDLYDCIIQDVTELAQVFSNALNESSSFWLITDTNTSYRGVGYSHTLLIDYINEKYSIVTTKNFYGSTVRFVQKK